MRTTTDDGSILEGEAMENQFVNHFKNFLGNSNGNGDWNFEGVFGTTLSNDEAVNMVREVTDAEIKCTTFNIGENKAPGPHGYTSTFFKKAWHVVGPDVCLAIKEVNCWVNWVLH